VFQKGDVMWTPQSLLLWPLSCTTAGIASGALGLGGGTVTSPIMLMMGMEPRVVAAPLSPCHFSPSLFSPIPATREVDHGCSTRGRRRAEPQHLSAQVAASAAFMILFTASCTSVQYLIQARLQARS
jgi:hypothetical protein